MSGSHRSDRQDPHPAAATVWFAPIHTAGKESLVARCGKLAERAGLRDVIAKDDFVAIKLHFGETGNTGFVSPVFAREMVRLVKEAGGRPFLTDANTLYTGQRANAVDHIACAVHNGFSFATVDAPIIIADGLDGRDSVEVPIAGLPPLRHGAHRRGRDARGRPGGDDALSRATSSPASAGRSRTSAWAWVSAAPSSACTPTSSRRSSPTSAPGAAAAWRAARSRP